ncbi:MAG: hypothetical protein A2X64_00535 [Ignavibacteria bacterium GWF2_33_9]|nr:MAG: hypothetical protein A2X64_00535 [Ignavibacteria bacterium GWF2_33_9]
MNSQNQSQEFGTLYIVSTPIGNKKDITYRAAQILQNADIVVGEEFKETSKLLMNLSLTKDIELLNEHNEGEQTGVLLELLKSGKSLALVSDCGTPIFADPGLNITKLCISHGIEVHAIPGASSIMTALVTSGFTLKQFLYAGFLQRTGEERIDEILQLTKVRKTVVVMDTPYRLKVLLEAFASIIPHRPAYVGMNLTMGSETHHYGTFRELYNKFKSEKFKAEYVLVFQGLDNSNKEEKARLSKMITIRKNNPDNFYKLLNVDMDEEYIPDEFNNEEFSNINESEEENSENNFDQILEINDILDEGELDEINEIVEEIELDELNDLEDENELDEINEFDSDEDIIAIDDEGNISTLSEFMEEAPIRLRENRTIEPKGEKKRFDRSQRGSSYRDRRRSDDRPRSERSDDRGGDRPRFERSGGSGEDRPRSDRRDNRGGDRPRFERRDDRGGDRPRFERSGGSGEDRPRFDRRDDRGGDRPRFERSGGSGSDRPRFERSGGSGSDRPRFERSGGSGEDRPRSDRRDNRGGDRPRFERSGDRPRSDRRDDRGGDRPRFGRSGGSGSDRPRFERSGGSGSDRPRFERSGGSGSDRPRFERSGGSGGDRPRFERSSGSGGDRPRFDRRDDRGGDRPRFEKRDDFKRDDKGSSFGDRPKSRSGGDRDSRGGERKFGSDKRFGDKRKSFSGHGDKRKSGGSFGKRKTGFRK